MGLGLGLSLSRSNTIHACCMSSDGFAKRASRCNREGLWIFVIVAIVVYDNGYVTDITSSQYIFLWERCMKYVRGATGAYGMVCRETLRMHAAHPAQKICGSGNFVPAPKKHVKVGQLSPTWAVWGSLEKSGSLCCKNCFIPRAKIYFFGVKLARKNMSKNFLP